jgi:hypothetical protein
MMMKRIRGILIPFCLMGIQVEAQEPGNSLEIYGFITTDAGYNFNTIDPNWYDVMRPTKLPEYEGQFAPEGHVFFSVRQTRFGVRNISTIKNKELKVQIDFDLFGFGADAGQTTIHLINAFAQRGKWTVGRSASIFMDVDAYPVTLDYWGPMTRIFNFNVQVRYTPIDNKKRRLALALERPGATSDESPYSGSIEIKNVKPVFKLPNITGHYRQIFGWGYVQLGWILKSMKWKDLSGTSQLSGSALGLGADLSGVARLNDRISIKFQGVLGQGIQSYIADAPPDVGLQSSHDGDPAKPFYGKALPVMGFFSFLEIKLNPRLESSMGYSLEKVTNSDLQLPGAFRKGQYALINFRYYPVKQVMFGLEYQYGSRNNFSDGFQSHSSRLQVSAKINFSSLAL